ncbi:MAG: 3-oxoacyl-[acyl-carrier-protein] synthase III C-terminal domain-containing protein [Nitrospirota bacterium]
MITLQENSRIASVAVAFPPFSIDQAEAVKILNKHYAEKLNTRNRAIMQKVFGHPSIQRRYLAVEDPECLINEEPDSRIARFTHWAVTLSREAILSALNQAGLTIDAVSGLVVNTCTGYICPGVSTYLIEELGLSRDTRAYDLVGSGCGGAIPNLQICEDILQRNDDCVVVSVSVEICSATFQMGDDPGLIISNAIFSDGAAAAVLWNQPRGLELIASKSSYATEYRNAVRYVHRNGQLYNQLSLTLPHVASKAVARVVMNLLEPMGLKVEDIQHWALHPGGEKIISTVRDEIGLSEKQVNASRDVLAEYGNMSSPTVWFVLRKILDRGIAPGDWCIMVAFGAGLSAHAFLLRVESANEGSNNIYR